MREAFLRAGMNVPDEPERRNQMASQTSPQSRRCDNCGNMFQPRQPHHRRCDNCFSQPQSSGGQAVGRQNAPQQQTSNYRYQGQFPDSYFEADEQGKIYLLTDFVAKSKVDGLAQHLTHQNSRPALTTGQIRRFFSHCREIERRLKADGENWPQVAADFVSLSAHAQYARSSGKIPEDFRQFIDENVKKVTSWEDPRTAFLDGFVPHFEALVGFGAKYMRAS